MRKINLKDVTFICPVRIDSPERLNNILAIHKYLSVHFLTNFIFCEADTEQTPVLNEIPGYYYEKDCDPVFHHTRYRNQMKKKCGTPIIGIWDADVLAPVAHIIASVNAIREDKYSMTWPYDGTCYSIPEADSDAFREEKDLSWIQKKSNSYSRMYGKHTVGGAFFVNKSDYIQIGMENEYIYGWGPEDTERLKRATILEIPVLRIKGDLFHLHHPRCMNSKYANREQCIKNINELLRICRLSKKELKYEIESWAWTK